MTVDELIAYLRRFQGAPYVYGGNGPYFDCSGLVCEALKFAGVLRPTEDLSAQQLYERFQESDSYPVPGALVFFGKNLSTISHVGVVVDKFRMIEAGGGDATTKDVHTALKQGAMVRERPFGARKDLLTFCLPPYPRPS